MLRHDRHLPHWDAVGQPQFITFRLHGSLPATRVFRREHVATSGEAFVLMDKLLDKAATGPLYLKRPEIAELVVEALLDSDLRFHRCQLHTFVVMPNHVHLLATQKAPFAKWLGPLEGFTAKRANDLIGQSGKAFWQNESYDHVVRDEEQFLRIRRYIEWNPVRAGLVERPEEFRWSSSGGRLERRLAGMNARPTN
jgi:REP element-mobilizing transposase RayT